jgi:hypothetical protein
MHVLDAAAQTLEQYPGGAESLAPRVGMSAGILRNKVNANCTTNHLTLIEANRLMTVTGDHTILQALAQEHGYTLTAACLPADAAPIVSQILALSAAEGRFAQTIHDALADGIISPNEMNAIAGAGHDSQCALIGVIQRLRAASEKAGAL